MSHDNLSLGAAIHSVHTNAIFFLLVSIDSFGNTFRMEQYTIESTEILLVATRTTQTNNFFSSQQRRLILHLTIHVQLSVDSLGFEKLSWSPDEFSIGFLCSKPHSHNATILAFTHTSTHLSFPLTRSPSEPGVRCVCVCKCFFCSARAVSIRTHSRTLVSTDERYPKLDHHSGRVQCAFIMRGLLSIGRPNSYCWSYNCRVACLGPKTGRC